MAAHPGFKAVQNSIAKKEGVSEKSAGAILASSSRKASPEAKEKNPRLNKVKGAKNPKMTMTDAYMEAGRRMGMKK